MTINGIKTASNQKSNRSPQMDLREDQVEEVLYQLRGKGAVIEVHSGGRVPKFKHQLYEWLGVEKTELAVMAELLLRGEQSLGDLRARASRMDKIAGINELTPIVAELIAKNLIVELTPPGRGQIVTHNLYSADELARLRSQFGTSTSESESPKTVASPGETDSVAGGKVSQPASVRQPRDPQVEQLAQELSELKQTVNELRDQLHEIRELLQ
jgi:uncharacterized protein YceH (UPF0502 family)